MGYGTGISEPGSFTFGLTWQIRRPAKQAGGSAGGGRRNPGGIRRARLELPLRQVPGPPRRSRLPEAVASAPAHGSLDRFRPALVGALRGGLASAGV